MLNVQLDTKHVILKALFTDNILATTKTKSEKKQEKKNTKPRLT